ncbi:hypothetical protein N665_0144s0038 [Sinapis alba]|nr:hypothetical protein N665_0144s0038 [Sinapis alba]
MLVMPSSSTTSFIAPLTSSMRKLPIRKYLVQHSTRHFLAYFILYVNYKVYNILTNTTLKFILVSTDLDVRETKVRNVSSFSSAQILLNFTLN